MKKLAYLLPAVAALALTACTDDVSGSGTDGDTEDTTDGDPTTGPGTTEPGSTTDPTLDPTLDPDTGSSSTTDPGPLCDETDECIEASDCEVGQLCTGCFCVDDPNAGVCPRGWGDGEYADCVTEGNGVCTSDSGLTPGCVVDDPGAATAGACFFSGCDTACDCPAPPDAAFEDQVTCDDVIGDGANDCYIDCIGNGECPDGMFCFLDVICFHGEEAPASTGYGDCINNVGCANGNEGCIVDAEPPNLGFCTSSCTSVDDCNPIPDTGDAPAVCMDLTGDDMGECYLDCSGGQTCPDGMVCGLDLFCAWEPIPVPGYNDCATQPDLVCLDGETCVATTDKTNGDSEICAATGCVDPAMDCPDLPLTGDAPAACMDIDGMAGDECVLDCSGGQACPDGAVCTDGGFCSYDVPTFTFQEDFEGGMLPEGWTVHDVDGLNTAMQTSFVTDALVVSNAVAGPNYWAVSTSWYSPAGQSDDWIISPSLTLAATATLVWSALAIDPLFPDGYEVYVVPSTVPEFADFVANGDPTDFLALDELVVPSAAPVFAVVAEEAELQSRSVVIGGLAGQNVYIAFRNNSDDMNLLLIDNVWVIE